MKRKLFIVFLALWGLLIFFFSSQSYSEQNLTPYLTVLLGDSNFGKVFSHIQFTYAGREISVSNLGMVHFVEFFIRKAAHLFVFFVLGALSWLVSTRVWKSNRTATIVAAFFVFLYASLDEIHQHYTNGRSPLVEDVLLDTCGGILGIMTYIIVFRMKKK
ncbi:VanZ family protein [Peribacillus asahii]|uniref:VanZ family protein n=1 Tax=Peribacillus asahii TaxID=228899 RepID=A0A398B7G1_9BACI|nr:VanZ family protein [Peribacillus asahii]RID84748.1 VanZ family protein [Peribacillus asahii]